MAQDLDLTEDDFQSTIDDNEFVLVMFFAPWCGHCKSMKPAFKAAAEKASEEGKFVLAKVDCTADDAKSVCEEFGVKGYPTLKFFKKGEANDYGGPRDTEGILTWLEKKSGPPAIDLDSAAAIKKFLKKKPSIIGYFAADSKEQKAFLAAADSSKLEEVFAGQVTDKSLFGEYKSGDVVFTNKDGVQKFKTGTDGEELAQTLFEASFPLVQEVGANNFQSYVSLGKPLYLLFIEPSDDNKDQILKDLEAVAKKNPDEAFTWIDAVKYKAQIKGMGASGSVVPCIIRMSSFKNDNKPITLEKEGLNEEIIGEWVEGIASGKYTYTPKSEDIPKNNDGPVTVLVGKNFDDIVMDETKDVFVEFYAPWCGHCKSLAPKWDKLGEEFADNDNVVIAKIDATANDVESHGEVKGFPTLLFYKKGGKTSPISYSGARETDDLASWVREQVGLEDTGKDEL